MIQTNLFRLFKPTSSIIRSFTGRPVSDTFYGLAEEETSLRKSVRSFLEKELAPYASGIDKNDGWDNLRDFWKKLGGQGLIGVTCPTKYGGTGLNFMAHVLVVEEISRISGSMGLSYVCHSDFCLNQLARNASEEQKEKYLPKLCTGEHFGAVAMTEPTCGSDVVNMKLHADRKGDYYVLNGNKMFITNGPDAETLLVYAKTDMSRKQHGITAFIIEKGMEGFSAGPKLDKYGMRGSNTSELFFEDCRVPAKNIVKKEGQGVGVLMSGLVTERLVGSAICLGIMQAACDVAFEYAHQREAFGQKIGTFQLMQGKLADMYMQLSSSRAFCYTVARAADNGLLNCKDASALFCILAEHNHKICDEAMQMMGGNGYMSEYPVGRFMRDAKLLDIGGGTKEIRRLVIGRALNEEYFK